MLCVDVGDHFKPIFKKIYLDCSNTLEINGEVHLLKKSLSA